MADLALLTLIPALFLGQVYATSLEEPYLVKDINPEAGDSSPGCLCRVSRADAPLS